MTTHANTAAPRRKIGFHHMAFLRGCIQDAKHLKTWWDTYLFVDGPFRAPTAKRTLRWIKDELGVLARREGRPRIEAILRRDSSRMEEVDRPALDEFAARYPEGFYSERELQEMWEQEYGGATPRQRLIERQLEALRWLDTLAPTSPLAQDRLDAWLEPTLAKNLKDGGLTTFGDLVDRMNGKLHWWSGIPKVGVEAARRVFRFIKENRASLQLPVSDHANPPEEADPAQPEATLPAKKKIDPTQLQLARGMATAIVPLENFLVPSELDGSQGHYRVPRHLNMLGVENDMDAAMAFVFSKRSPHTQRAYRKEIERLMLWAILVRKKALSSLSHADALAYQAFLRDPQPSSDWCGKRGSRGNRRFGPLWRPFEGPLSEGAERYALRALMNFYEFLMRKSYITGNPFSDITPAEAERPKMKVGHAFSEDQWSFIQFMLTQGKTETGAWRRLVFAVNFLYATGLRLDEVVRATLGDIKFVEFTGGVKGCMMHVLGKGKRNRKVPLPDGVVELLGDYLRARGLDPDPRNNDVEAFLLGRIDDAATRLRNGVRFEAHEGISAATLYDQLKDFFGMCADEMALEDKAAASHLRAASTHWLRHTFATHHIARMGMDIVQIILGHATPATTAQYNDVEEKRVFMAMQKAWKAQPPV